MFFLKRYSPTYLGKGGFGKSVRRTVPTVEWYLTSTEELCELAAEIQPANPIPNKINNDALMSTAPFHFTMGTGPLKYLFSFVSLDRSTYSCIPYRS